MIQSKFTSVILLGLLSSANLYAENWQYKTRGYMFARLSSYTTEKSRNYGQQARAQFEQTTDFGSSFYALNQLRWTSNSINADLNTGTSTLPKKDSFETYLGENYLKYKSDNWVIQLGYQEVVWGEAFGFNYADVISPKDLRETLYSDASDARLPLMLFNGKTFFSSGDLSGSLQFLYSPEPRFSKTLPIEVYAGNLFNSGLILNVEKAQTPIMFKHTEMGGKFSASYSGLDLSLFGFSYLDRDAHYVLNSATLAAVNLKEVHSHIKMGGLSLAKTISDFVLRTDIVITKDKIINYIENSQLKNFTTDALNAVASIDSPTYDTYSGVLVFAKSSLKDILPNAFREKNEEYMIAKINKDFGSDKSWEFSYTHEFEHTGHSIQTYLNWPINSTTDLKLGGQFYFGDETSNLNKFKNISSVFCSLKNYFQL